MHGHRVMHSSHSGIQKRAAPPSRAYRARKFLRRNRLSFAVASAFLLLLIVAVVVSVSLAVRARQAEREALAGLSHLQAPNLPKLLYCKQIEAKCGIYHATASVHFR